MNPGDKVRVTKSIPSHLPKEGVFKEWIRNTPQGTPYCIVEFVSTNPKLGKYLMTINPWDLELVNPDPVPDTCDNKVVRGQYYKQEHSCTLPADHKNDHYCGVCRFSWENIDQIQASKRITDEPVGLKVIYDSDVPIGQVYLGDWSNNERS